jgi:hypothetical protein
VRVRAIKEHAARMQLGIAYWRQQGNDREVERCRRALEWAWRELGLL